MIDINTALQVLGIKKLRPIQELYIREKPTGNILVVSPTGSGKTIVGFLHSFLNWDRNKGPIVYVAPLRVLAKEKYRRLLSLSEKLSDITGERTTVGFFTGESESPMTLVDDFISCTAHKFFHFLARNRNVSISAVILDEMHNITGALDGLVPLVMNTGAAVSALSATINESDIKMLARILGAKVLYCNKRPVPLVIRVMLAGREVNVINLARNIEEKYPGGSRAKTIIELLHVHPEYLPLLIFVGSRRDATRLAGKIAELREETKKVKLPQTEDPYRARLYWMTKRGVAFHHAGLSPVLREYVEKAYRGGDIDILVATTTLAMGINLPASAVIVDYSVFHGEYRNMDFFQLAGRAGRPGLHEKGYAFLRIPMYHADTWEVISKLASKKIENIVPEAIKLMDEGVVYRVLNFRENSISEIPGHYYVLSYIVPVLTADEFMGTVTGTLMKKRNMNVRQLLSSIAYLLERAGIMRDGELTGKGKRYMMLGVCPLNAVTLSFPERCDIGEFLYILANTYEIQRTLPGGTRQVVETMYMWLMDDPLEDITKRTSLDPGDIYLLSSTFSWLASSFYIIYAAKATMRYPDGAEEVVPRDVLRDALKKGVPPWMVPLARIRGIGRVRARMLWEAGIHSVEELMDAGYEKIAKILKISEKFAKVILSDAEKFLAE